MRWTLLIPLKALPAAKSRLVGDLEPATHADLVEAIRADTLSAVRAAEGVARTVVVTDQPGVFEADLVIVQRASGLNGGLAEAATEVARRWPEDGIAAIVGDLPALTSGHLDQALDMASAHPRSFVPDAPGTGTTLLAAAPGVELVPEFGTGSAGRHRLVAAELPAGPTLRADVDTADDLAAARALGLGPRTSAVVDALNLSETVISDLHLNQA